MAATVILSETNGPVGTPVVTDGIPTINFGTADTPNLNPTSYPIPQGSAAYGKWLQVKVSAWGGSSHVSSLKFYLFSGALKTGEAIGGNFFPGMATYAATRISAYATATVAAGGGAVTTPITLNGSAVLGSPYAAFPVPSTTPSAENIMIGGAINGSFNTPTVTAYSNYLFLGLSTSSTTPPGALNQKVFLYQWNES